MSARVIVLLIEDDARLSRLNLLGEAVLGESEAVSRLARVRSLVERPDVDRGEAWDGAVAKGRSVADSSKKTTCGISSWKRPARSCRTAWPPSSR